MELMCSLSRERIIAGTTCLGSALICSARRRKIISTSTLRPSVKRAGLWIVVGRPAFSPPLSRICRQRQTMTPKCHEERLSRYERPAYANLYPPPGTPPIGWRCPNSSAAPWRRCPQCSRPTQLARRSVAWLYLIRRVFLKPPNSLAVRCGAQPVRNEPRERTSWRSWR